MEVQVSVIVSTYNSEESLQKVLWGFNEQTFKNFELIIADDGSGVKTEILLDTMDAEVFYPLIHVWQEDEGFQKSKILNKAILSCKSDYIIMTDGDCIPRNDFVETHWQHRQKGYFLSGGCTKLPFEISKKISKKDILIQNCFSISWLNAQNPTKKIKNKKLLARETQKDSFNDFKNSTAPWNGYNASGWKEDLLAVNGFDERMQYGGQDQELGARLCNMGIKSKQLCYSAICVHLYHDKTYKNEASIHKNKKIMKATRASKATWTSFGITQEEHPLEKKLFSYF